ncbi:MAG TPA: hypothetical protein VJX74_01990 [Blastocatellia bacterium]|nr:hypothetical protein [Blastocatellia bacterium]
MKIKVFGCNFSFECFLEIIGFLFTRIMQHAVRLAFMFFIKTFSGASLSCPIPTAANERRFSNNSRWGGDILTAQFGGGFGIHFDEIFCGRFLTHKQHP